MPKANDAPSKEPVGSMRDALSAAWESQESAGTEAETEVEATGTDAPEAKAEKAERARDKDGKFTKAGKSEPAETETTAEAGEGQAAAPPATAPAIEAIEPEEHWSEADKAAFRAIPADHRKWVFERYKRLESENTRKSQEAASLRSQRQQLDEVLGPYKQEFALAGLDEVGGLRYLLSVRDFLKSKPAEALPWLAQQFGVDLRQVVEGAPAVDPAVQAVNQSVAQIGQRLNQFEQNIANDRYTQAVRQIEAFASEKDTTGNLKHPHFQAVENTMTQLWQSGMVPVGDFESAYQKAVLFHGLSTPAAPSVATPAPAADKADELKANSDKAAAAAKAKKAAAGVSGSASAKPDRKMTIREELAARVNGSL